MVRGVQVLMSAGGPNYCAPEEELRVGGWALVATKKRRGIDLEVWVGRGGGGGWVGGGEDIAGRRKACELEKEE